MDMMNGPENSKVVSYCVTDPDVSLEMQIVPPLYIHFLAVEPVWDGETTRVFSAASTEKRAMYVLVLLLVLVADGYPSLCRRNTNHALCFLMCILGRTYVSSPHAR